MAAIFRVAAAAWLAGTIALMAGVVYAQPIPAVPAPTAKTPDKDAAPAESNPADKLSVEQQQIAEKYKHLEEVLLRMAELSASTDPRRAALLKKAVAQSKDQLITVRLERLVDMLGKDQLSKALENQTELDQDLRSVLELLMSEDRSKRIESEKARVREYLKRVNRLIKQEKDVQGRTGGGDDAKRLATEQGELAGKAGELAKDIQKNEEAKAGKPSGTKPDDKDKKGKDDGKPGDDKEGKKSDGKDGKKPDEKDAKKPEKSDGKDSKEQGKSDGKPKDDASPSKDGKKSDGKEGEPSESKDGKKQQGQQEGGSQSQGQPQDQENDQNKDQQPQEQENPARKRLEAAQQRMKEAEAKLKEAERKGATDKQEEAIRELEQAKAQLEQILRQLREEEIERMLAMLEGRFRKMLQMQQEVYEGTVRLDKVPEAERTHNHEIESSRLSGKESQIVVEVDKAAALLRDDGSAVAFPEAVEQLREDMQQVVQRLAQTKVGKVTQGIEEDIINGLQEMIEALKKAQKDLENKKQQQQKQQAGQPQDPPLVDQLAELKMIRALQMRVNTRTARYSKMIEGEQAENVELVDALKRLAEREHRIHRVTHDLQLEKNQ